MPNKARLRLWATCACLTLLPIRVVGATDLIVSSITIQAEDFDNGGPLVGYVDTSVGNAGGAYRATDVDIEPSSDTGGGYNVSKTRVGEWLRYAVSIAAPGMYALEMRVANTATGASFHVEVDGRDSSGPLTVPNTGGWQVWQTTTIVGVPLTMGAHSVRLVFDSPGSGTGVGNYNWIRLTYAGPAPYMGLVASVPGSIRVERFDEGGEGVGYHDTTAGNKGGQARQTDVDIETSGTGFNIGWNADGEWLSYAVNVAAAGAYKLQFKVASMYATGRVRATFRSATTDAVAVPNTGAWQTWTTVSVPVTLTAGNQNLRVIMEAGRFNLGGIELVRETPVVTAGTIRTVNAGGDLQAALNAALPGDTILLQPGATFTGNYVLPLKPGTNGDYITIRSGASDAALPASTVRMTPAFEAQLAKLQSPNSAPALSTAPGAHHYRLLFLEFRANRQGYGEIIALGDGSRAQNTLAMVPHDIIIDRVYVHGDVTYGQKRGIGLNSASTTIVNSYVSEIKAVGQDSQAICGWNGPGPFTIVNNYLEAAGENIMFGGADPAIPNLVPSDITFKNNHLSKPLAWRTQTQWNMKNLFELKNAQRVVVDGNLMEYNWLAAQVGYAVLFTPRNQGGTAPWSVVQQVLFTNNIVRHVSSGISILGNDDINVSMTTNDIVVRNNLFEDVSGAAYGGSGRFVLINGGANITIDHNTVLQDGWSALYAVGAPTHGLVFTNNIVPDYAWAIMGGGSSPGNATIAMYFPNGQFLRGIFAGSKPSLYPTGNFFPPNMGEVGFVDLANRNYRLAPSSIYRNTATDGTDPGANIDALNLAARTNY
jgi:hypothetical protein